MEKEEENMETQGRDLSLVTEGIEESQETQEFEEIEIASLEPDLLANTNAAKNSTEKRPEMNIIDILNLSLGTPESKNKYNLNLNMLYTLLMALIKEMGMEATKVPVLTSGVTLPSTNALLTDAGQDAAAVTEMWNVIKLQKESEANKEGIGKLMGITEDILNKLASIPEIKANMEGLNGEVQRLSLDIANQAKLLEDQRSDKQVSMEEESGASKPEGTKSKEIKKAGNTKGKGYQDAPEVTEGDSFEAAMNSLGLDPALESRIQLLEEQMKKVQKFRKAATAKLIDLPDNAADIRRSDEFVDLTGAVNDPAKLKQLLSQVGSLPEMTAMELRALNNVLKQALQGGEWDQLKRLIAGINNEDTEANQRLKRLEMMILQESEIESHLSEDSMSGEASGSKKATNVGKMGSSMRKPLRDLQDKVNELKKELRSVAENVRHILNDGGLEAANQTYEEMTRQKEEIDAIRLEHDRNYLLIDRIETEQREKESLINGINQELRNLREQKAERKWVMQEVDRKGNVADLNLKVSIERYERDLEQVDITVTDLQNRQNQSEEELTQDIRILQKALGSKLEKEEFEKVWTYLVDRMMHLERMLDWIGDVFNGDEDAACIRSRIIRYNCTSCDRPIHMAAQQPLPPIPNTAALNTTVSARPIAIFKMDQIRKAQRNNNLGECPQGVTYLRAIRDQEARRQERLARVTNDGIFNEPVGRVKRSDLLNFSTDAFLRKPTPGNFLDTYHQDPRPVGGEYTQVRADQKVTKDPIPILNQSGNNDAPLQGAPEVEVAQKEAQEVANDAMCAVPLGVREDATIGDLMAETECGEIFKGDDVTLGPPSTPN